MPAGKIICAVVALIGVYMVAMNLSGGFMSPPVLSGIAFILLGIKKFIK